MTRRLGPAEERLTLWGDIKNLFEQIVWVFQGEHYAGTMKGHKVIKE